MLSFYEGRSAGKFISQKLYFSEEDLPKSVLDELEDEPEPEVNDRLSDTSSSNSPIVVLGTG